jgi:hypothetical protein
VIGGRAVIVGTIAVVGVAWWSAPQATPLLAPWMHSSNTTAMNGTTIAPGIGLRRAMRLLFEASAIGEVAVGVAVILFPRTVSGFLLGAPIEGLGAVIARMAGFAVAALGLTWWMASSDLDRSLNPIAPGFFAYNLGVGLLFLLYALAATASVTVAWLVAAVHLLAGLGFCGVLFVQQRSVQIR